MEKIAMCFDAFDHVREVSSAIKLKFLKSCERFLTCEHDFLCLPEIYEKTAYYVMKAQCTSAKFVFNELAECDKKMEAKNSTINPFIFVQREGNVKPCEKLFGDDYPMMVKIREVCGQMDHDKFREKQIEVAHAMKVCNYTSTE